MGIAPIRPSLKQDEGIKVFDLVSEIGIKPARSGRSHNFFTTDQWTAGLPDLILLRHSVSSRALTSFSRMISWMLA